MDSISAGDPQDIPEPGAPRVLGYPFKGWDGDDNLGDEVAYPGTWQHLAAGDIAHD